VQLTCNSAESKGKYVLQVMSLEMLQASHFKSVAAMTTDLSDSGCGIQI
jgi:hypothetical protein